MQRFKFLFSLSRVIRLHLRSPKYLPYSLESTSSLSLPVSFYLRWLDPITLRGPVNLVLIFSIPLQCKNELFSSSFAPLSFRSASPSGQFSPKCFLDSQSENERGCENRSCVAMKSALESSFLLPFSPFTRF